MQILSPNDHIKLTELTALAANMFGNLIKAVVDIESGIVAIDAELHADLEAYLLERGSKQRSLWGINLHPDHFDTNNFIEFDSMINIRPSQNNPSRSVLDVDIQKQILTIIKDKVTRQ